MALFSYFSNVDSNDKTDYQSCAARIFLPVELFTILKKAIKDNQKNWPLRLLFLNDCIKELQDLNGTTEVVNLVEHLLSYT